MFTHIELFRLKQAQEILTRALSQVNPNLMLERELVDTLKCLQGLINSVKVKQDTMKKNV